MRSSLVSVAASSAWRRVACAQRGLSVTPGRPGPRHRAPPHTAAGMLGPGHRAALRGPGTAARSTWSRPAATRRSWRSCARRPAAPSATASAARCRRHGTRPIWPSCAALQEFQREPRRTSQLLTGRELRELEPALAPGLAGGLHAPGRPSGGQPASSWRRCWTWCVGAGVELVREKVADLDIENGRAAGVTLDNGERFIAGATVLRPAPGRLARPRCTRLPVRPVKGQTLRLRGRTGPLRAASSGAAVRGHPMYLVPRGRRRAGHRRVQRGGRVRPAAARPARCTSCCATPRRSCRS